MNFYPAQDNPWGLPGGQCATLDAMVQHGSHKLAADSLGLAINTTSEQIRRAMVRMGVRSPLLAILAWDRWTRGSRA